MNREIVRSQPSKAGSFCGFVVCLSEGYFFLVFTAWKTVMWDNAHLSVNILFSLLFFFLFVLHRKFKTSKKWGPLMRPRGRVQSLSQLDTTILSQILQLSRPLKGL